MSPSSFDLAQFIGRFHPVLVHLPIGVFLAIASLELAALRPAWKHLATANRALLWLATVSGAGAALCGWLLAADGGYDPDLIDRHRWAGVAAVVGLAIVLGLHHLRRPHFYRFGLLVLLPLVSATGHFGGDLTHGRGFLTRHAPEPLRRWLGETPATHPTPPSPHPTDPLQRPVYESFVQPMLNSYCTSCHGSEKAKGGLRLDTLEAILRGGESGPGVIPGRSTESPLLARIRLPMSHDEHMPPEGKPQPTTDDLSLLAWWIDTGALPGRTAADLQAPDSLRSWLSTRPSTPSQP